jgi:CheY-like chemotaxis protein
VATTKFDEAAPQQKASPVLHGVTVLVVDDDPNALEFVRAALERFGAIVVTAGSAREARSQIATRAPDVLLSDLLMPDEDGLQLIRDIRRMDDQHGGSMPAAALTALGGDDERRRAIKAGYQMHVEKPVDPVDLAVAVKRLARQRVTH